MSERLTVHRDGNAIYDIVIESSFERLGEELSALGVNGKKLCIVTDSTVAPLYMEQVREQLLIWCAQVDVFTFPAGEEYKNLDTVKKLYEFLILKRYDRSDVLVALGGGVVGDLCGYTAATYLRGVRFIQIPTTLLSQVDSSIGGKTGVDFDAYKNMVGAFHMPILVYTNTATLLTLTQEQFCCGMGEIIKHGLIKSREYYQWIENHKDRILARDPAVCETMILESDKIKRAVVEQDPTEKGERALLNFGHTLGHAIEKLMQFQLMHGQCVALGCASAAYLSAKRGEIAMEEVDQIRNMLGQFGLPSALGDWGLNPEDIIAATKNDKKMESGKIKFVLLHQIGNAYVDRTVTDDEMMNAVRWLLGGVHEE